MKLPKNWIDQIGLTTRKCIIMETDKLAFLKFRNGVIHSVFTTERGFLTNDFVSLYC